MKLIHSLIHFIYLFYDSASTYGFRIHTNYMSTSFDTNGAIWSEYSSMFIVALSGMGSKLYLLICHESQSDPHIF